MPSLRAHRVQGLPLAALQPCDGLHLLKEVEAAGFRA